MTRLGGPSFWYADAGLPALRPALQGDCTVDVAIIGAGYTGLWAAWYLRKADPTLNILLIEKNFAGFGASGRNGGWLTGGFAWSHARYAKTHGEAATRAMVAAMNGTVDEVLAVAAAEGIEADIYPTDELMVATNPAQLARLRAEVVHRRHWGEADRVREIGAAEAMGRVAVPGTLGGMIVEGVARVQPAKLVQGLAQAVERAGARIVEQTEVLSYGPGQVTTTRGIVQAGVILRATEGFTAGLPGHRRDWLALNSAQIVTEPLPPALWDQIGWQGHEILGDFANAYCYCQRTREGRIAVGGRGVPYRFGNGTDREGVPDPETLRRLTTILHRHFPAARDARIDHGWCGVLAVPRDWCASLGFDRATGLGFAGGYVGVGVSTSNLAGRTLADLVTGQDSALVHLPWVNRQTRKWEPEPLRWLGVRGMYALLNTADRREAALGLPKTSAFARLGNWMTGRG
ncbi:MAG TPA: FAD-binding oxidoreductase [Gemmobacter sp.]|nr:FAD-binding oxidoreductase [Gemmobacter sp.]